MIKLSDLKNGAKIKGLTGDQVSIILNAEWYGQEAVKVVFEDANWLGLEGEVVRMVL